MKVGVPTETKPDEYRVALTPVGARELAERGHEILIQRGAGEGSAISDSSYEAQGARIVPAAEDVFGEADLVLKVKEPQPGEVSMFGSREHAVHVPAPGAGAGPDPRPLRVGRHLRRLRDGRGHARTAAAAGADERDRRQDRHPGGRLHARKAARRAGHPARRGSRRGLGQRDDHRRWSGRHERRLHRDRHGGRRVRLRHQHRPPARAGRGLQRAAPRPSSRRPSRSRSASPTPTW